MKIRARFGEYGTHPKDKEPVEVNLPDDALIYTPGPHFIGHGLYRGALHYMVITKASNDEINIKLKGIFGVDIETECIRGHYLYDILRLNGWALIHLYDCIIESDINLLSEEEFNNMIGMHGLYYVYLNENYHIIKIIRINHIKASEWVECSVIYHTAEMGDSPCHEIRQNAVYSLRNIISPHHSVLLRKPDPNYGYYLFNDMTQNVLHIMDPNQYPRPTVNYDLDWLHDNFMTTYPEIQAMKDGEWTKMLDMAFKVPKPEVREIYNDIFEFKKELPIK